MGVLLPGGYEIDFENSGTHARFPLEFLGPRPLFGRRDSDVCAKKCAIHGRPSDLFFVIQLFAFIIAFHDVARVVVAANRRRIVVI